MNSQLVKLVTLTMLIVYGLVASTAGRVLYIPIGHDHSGFECVLEQNDRQGASHPVETETGCVDHSHEHGPFDNHAHADSECGCHIHVPMPGEQPVVRNQRVLPTEAPSSDVSPWVFLLLACSTDAPAKVCGYSQRPDPRAKEQVRALKSVRLLI